MKAPGFSLSDMIFAGALLAFIVVAVTLKSCAESLLWPGGIIDVPAEQGNAGFTLAYDSPTAYAWVAPEGNGGKYGYLIVADYVLAPLTSNDQGQAGPPEQIAFFGHSSDIVSGVAYRLATSNQDVAALSPMPPTVSLSAAWTIDGGGRVSLVPEPSCLALLAIGLSALIRTPRNP